MAIKGRKRTEEVQSTSERKKTRTNKAKEVSEPKTLAVRSQNKARNIEDKVPIAMRT